MSETQQTLDQPALVKFLSIPEYPDALTLPKAGPLARSGVFVKAKKKGQFYVQDSIRGYIKHLLGQIHDPWVGGKVLAERIGVDTRYIAQMRVDGTLTHYKDQKYELNKSIKEYCTHIRKLGQQGGKSLAEERTRLTRAQADNEELKLEERRGVLIHMETALEIWQTVISAFKSKIYSVEVQIKPIIESADTKKERLEAYERLETLHREALYELSGINSADYADNKQVIEDDEAPAKSNNKRVGRPRKSTKPGAVKRTRKISNKPI